MINNGQELLDKFDLGSDREFYDPVILSDADAGFSIRRNYPEEIRYKPARGSDKNPDNVAVIWVVFDKKRIEADDPNLVPIRCRIATMSIYRAQHWDYDFDDPKCPSKDSVEMSNASPQPFSLDFPSEYFYNAEKNIFLTKIGVKVSGIEILNSIFKEHVDSVHLFRGFKYKIQSLKNTAENSFFEVFIKLIKITLKFLFGRTIDEDWKVNSAFRGYPMSAFKKLQLSSIEILGYRTSKNVIVIFCLLVVFFSFLFLPLEDGSYPGSVLDSEILTTIHALLGLIILDEAVPLILFGLMNLLIFFRRKRFFSRF
jgi:hypothetical protein